MGTWQLHKARLERGHRKEGWPSDHHATRRQSVILPLFDEWESTQQPKDRRS